MSKHEVYTEIKSKPIIKCDILFEKGHLRSQPQNSFNVYLQSHTIPSLCTEVNENWYPEYTIIKLLRYQITRQAIHLMKIIL